MPIIIHPEKRQDGKVLRMHLILTAAVLFYKERLLNRIYNLTRVDFQKWIINTQIKGYKNMIGGFLLPQFIEPSLYKGRFFFAQNRLIVLHLLFYRLKPNPLPKGGTHD